jgi:DNA-binding transcriptional MerR regulator
MPTSYPISAVAKLTGIPLDTLRAWERRYRTVIPQAVGARTRLFRGTNPKAASAAAGG